MNQESEFVRKFSKACEKVATWMPGKFKVVFAGAKRSHGVSLHYVDIEGNSLCEIKISTDDNGQHKIMSSQDDIDTVMRELGYEFQIEKIKASGSDEAILISPNWDTTYWPIDRQTDWIKTVECNAPIKIVAAMLGMIDAVEFESRRRKLHVGVG